LIAGKEDYERHKKLLEEQNKLELLKRESDMIQYKTNELQLKLFYNVFE
jgi:hypothetical protein